MKQRTANIQHTEVGLLLRLLLSKIKCGFGRLSILAPKGRSECTGCVLSVKKKKKREGRQDDKLASTHQCQAQPVFFKIRPSVRVAILSFKKKERKMK